MKQLFLLICFSLFLTPSRSSSGSENGSASRILQEVHFVYFIGNQHFEDWQWFTTDTPAKEIEFAFRRWVRVIEKTAVKRWEFTGVTEVEFLPNS